MFLFYTKEFKYLNALMIMTNNEYILKLFYEMK